MNDTITLDNDQWSAKELTEAQRENRAAAELIPFGEGGMSPQNFAQVVDFSKHMANAKGILGPHLVGNYAGCLAIIELAQQFRMRPFMLARQTYFVNGMIAFDGQAIMSIMNLHMPLETEDGKKTRLRHRFEGERAVYEPEEVDEVDERTGHKTGKKIWITKLIKPSTRKIILTGRMKHEAHDLEYESPPVFQIKNKKSPLWVEDEDQQLIYWGSRRWQRRHWPEGMLGILDREEAEQMHLGADHAKLIGASNPEAGKELLQRIAQAQSQTDAADADAGVREGFKPGFAHQETAGVPMIKAASSQEIKDDTPPVKAGDDRAVTDLEKKLRESVGKTDAPETEKKSSRSRKAASKKDEPQPEEKQPEPEHEVLPTNEREWQAYCLDWIAKTPADELQKRWDSERGLRNACGIVSGNLRDSVFLKLNNKIHGE